MLCGFICGLAVLIAIGQTVSKIIAVRIIRFKPVYDLWPKAALKGLGNVCFATEITFGYNFSQQVFMFQANKIRVSFMVAVVRKFGCKKIEYSE